jgi:sarcosine oxidase subunit beta
MIDIKTKTAETPKAMTTQTADIIIVGGGLAGVSLAHHLADSGAGRVLVLERQQVGAGSTGRSVATLYPLTTSPDLARLYSRSLDIYADFQESIGVRADIEYRPMAVIADDATAAPLADAVRVAGENKLHLEHVSPGDFLEAEPGFNPAGVSAVAVSKDGGIINPEPTTVAYLERAKEARVGIWEGMPVHALLTENGKVTGVRTPSGDVAAPVVVLAAGAWTGKLLEATGAHNPFTDREQVVGVFDVPPHGAPLAHVVLDLPNAVAYRFAMVNRYVFQPLTVGSVTESAMNADPSLYVGLMSDLRERIVGRFPDLEQSVLQPGWSGLWNLTPDGLPVAGETEIEGLHVLAGFGNSGFLTIPALAERMGHALAGGDASALAPFSPRRFPTDKRSPWGDLII